MPEPASPAVTVTCVLDTYQPFKPAVPVIGRLKVGVDIPAPAGSTPEALRRQLAGDLQTLVPLIKSKQDYLD